MSVSGPAKALLLAATLVVVVVVVAAAVRAKQTGPASGAPAAACPPGYARAGGGCAPMPIPDPLVAQITALQVQQGALDSALSAQVVAGLTNVTNRSYVACAPVTNSMMGPPIAALMAAASALHLAVIVAPVAIWFSRGAALVAATQAVQTALDAVVEQWPKVRQAWPTTWPAGYPADANCSISIVAPYADEYAAYTDSLAAAELAVESFGQSVDALVASIATQYPPPGS